jgi:hypothetical protein
VSDVMINGKMVMQKREMLTLDEKATKIQVREIAKKVALI